MPSIPLRANHSLEGTINFHIEKPPPGDMDMARKPLSDRTDCDPTVVGEEKAEENKKIRELAEELDQQGKPTILQKLVEYNNN